LLQTSLSSTIICLTENPLLESKVIFILIELLERIFSSKVLQILIFFMIISTIIWVIFVSFLTKISLSNGILNRNILKILKYKTMNHLMLALSIVIILVPLLHALSQVGYLPYGPDTAEYTGIAKSIELGGHYHGGGYYSVFHTSAVLYHITSFAFGSQEVAFAALLVAFATSLVLISSMSLSTFYGTFHGLYALIFALLFVSSPPVGGYDLLQQYVSSVYAVLGIALMLSSIIGKRDDRRLAIYVLMTLASAVTHLTSVLLLVLLLSAYFAISRNPAIRNAVVIFVVSELIYMLFAATMSSKDIVRSLIDVLLNLKNGTFGEPIVRAYSELPTAELSIFSWTLLPSMSLAILARQIVSLFNKTVKGKKSFFHKDNVDAFLCLSLFSALVFLGISFLSRIVQVDIARYLWQPSYVIMLLCISGWFSKALTPMYAKQRRIHLVVFVVLLAPYLFAALNDPARSPQSGGLRLAPVTYIDRIEMLPVARLGIDGYYVFAWHDVYIPVEASIRNPCLLPGSGSYYPEHIILLQVAEDKRVGIPLNSYLILRKEVISAKKFTNYNIVLNSLKHLVLIPSI